MDFDWDDIPKVIPAGYTPIQEDVPLVRTAAKVPVEPMPDHKIVVEIAGQSNRTATNFLLAKTDSQQERIASEKHDAENKHRSLITFSELTTEPKNLYIRIPRTDNPRPVTLKIAEGILPVAKSVVKDEWDTVLVPVIPLRPRGDAHQAYTEGYVYVMWQGKIWRELAIDHRSFFSDIDIHYQRQKPAQTRHVNLNGMALLPETNLSFEDYQSLQNGKQVFSGQLDLNAHDRVFGFTEP